MTVDRRSSPHPAGETNPLRALPRLFARLLVSALLAFAAMPAHATPSLVVDADTLEVLHAQDADVPWYPASLTKLMTAFVVFERLRAGQATLDMPVVLSAHAAGQPSIAANLRAGNAMTLEDALFAVVVASANDVAVAIAETIAGSEESFVRQMNETAARRGLTASSFANPHGLFDGRQRSSARDLALLTIAIRNEFPEHMRFFGTGRVVISGKPFDSYNELLTRFPGTVGMKTGYVCAAGRNIVAAAENGGRAFLAVVLGATTERERSERAAQLLSQAFEGQLGSDGRLLSEMENRTGAAPVDMRTRLCGSEAPAYERAQLAVYPMGLPGHASYLGEPSEPRSHVMEVWRVPPPPGRVPVPTPRPERP